MDFRPRAQSQALLILGRLEEHGLAKVGSGCVEVDRKAEQKEATGRVGFNSARRQLSSLQMVGFLTTEASAAASRPATKTTETCMMARRTVVNSADVGRGRRQGQGIAMDLSSSREYQCTLGKALVLSLYSC